MAEPVAPVLRYYSLNDEVTLQCDTSDTGLGAALLQLHQPVSFSSRALTQTAIVFACEKFDKYIFGRDVIHTETDHKPLEEIFKKSLCDAPARLQRMLLRLQRYNLDVKYKKGPLMYIADTLSRAYLDETSRPCVFLHLDWRGLRKNPPKTKSVKLSARRF